MLKTVNLWVTQQNARGKVLQRCMFSPQHLKPKTSIVDENDILRRAEGEEGGRSELRGRIISFQTTGFYAAILS